MFVSDDSALAERVRRLKFHGLGVDAYDRLSHGRKPQAEVIEPGFKYNPADLNAALALVQLKRLDALNARRQALAERYLERLAGLPLAPLGLPAHKQRHAWHLFILRIDAEACGLGRDAFMEALKVRGIGSGIHFIASHLHHYYRQRQPRLSLPNSEWNSARLCSIPLFPDMRDDDIEARRPRHRGDPGETSMKPYPIDLVSVVIPVYNEEASLPELLRRTEAACLELGRAFEIVLVDDGSRDRSAELLQAAAERDGSAVVAVILNRNYGQHAAILAGFEQSRGDLVITLDADLQNPPEEIPRLVERAAQGYDVVGSIRAERQDSAWRRWPSRLVNLAVQRSTGVAMHDYGCMLRAYRRSIVEAMLACRERSTFIPILANGFARHTCEIRVAHAERAHGESKYSAMRLLNLMFDLVTCMTTTPLRLLSLVGGGMALAGFLFALFLLVLRLAFGAAWAGNGLFVLFAVLFMFSGVQLLGMGLLGEYLGRMYSDVARGRASSSSAWSAPRPPRFPRPCSGPVSPLHPASLPRHDLESRRLRLPRHRLHRYRSPAQCRLRDRRRLHPCRRPTGKHLLRPRSHASAPSAAFRCTRPRT